MRDDRLEYLWRDRGREFHSLGAITLKDLPPNVKRLKAGTTKRPTSEDHRVRGRSIGEKEVSYIRGW